MKLSAHQYQILLDRFHVGAISERRDMGDELTVLTTAKGRYAIVETGLEDDGRIREYESYLLSQYPQTKLLLLPDYRQRLTIRVQHRFGHYYCVFALGLAK